MHKYTDLLSNLTKNLIINKKNQNLININNNNIYNNNIISKYNNKWDYSQIIYNYNNNNLLSNLKYKYIIKKYINNMLNHKLTPWNNNNQINVNILYKEPIILINKNEINIILFIYKPIIKNQNVNYHDLLITKLINNLINKPLNQILNNNLIINIKPIILTYDYLDSNIYSKSLSKHLSKYPKLDTIKNIKINQKILNNILMNKLSKNKLLENINLLNNYQFELNNGLNNYSIINKNIFIYSNLLHQFITGNIWKYRGKNFNSESNARALKTWNDNKLNQSLSLNNAFKLNYYSANLTLGQSNVISKNGKFNVKVQFNHF